MLILSAGMPRSGSTWLYNALRLLLRERFRESDDALACGWVGDLHKLRPDAPCRLVKIHEWDEALVAQADRIVWSFRDLRDVLASQSRKFGIQPSVAAAGHWIVQDRIWRSRADYVMRYEDMRADPVREVSRLAAALRMTVHDPAALVRAVGQMSYASDGVRNDVYNELTLLHRDHVTDGRHGSWPNGLEAALEREIVGLHGAWFTLHGYVTPTLC